jgi:hypothetical protein
MGAKPEIVPVAFSEPRGSRPRVLVEASEWARATAISQSLDEAGIEAVICGGPEGHDLRCPFVGGGPCVSLDGADAIVFMLRLTDVRNLELLGRLRQKRADLPMVIAVPPPLADRYADVLAGARVVAWSATAADVVAAVGELIQPPAA